MRTGDNVPFLGIRYDLRAPDWGPTTHGELYGACIEQCRWADQVGFDAVIVSEHHGAEDGFMSAPLTLAAAIGAVTSRPAMTLSAALVTMHDPLRFAEQLATVDLIAPGRLTVILGTGYRQAEFDMMGLDFKDRWRVFDENVEAIRQALTGEPFTYQGRKVVVTPKPSSPGQPLLVMGGSTENAARRAARLRLGFFAAASDQQLAAFYQDECAKVGFDQGFCSVPAPLGFIHVSDDPERDWERIAPHALHEAQVYGSWQRAGQHSAVSIEGPVTLDTVKQSGIYRVLTPDECVDFWNSLDDFGTFLLHPLMGGIPPALAQESIERFESKVLPRIRPAA